MKKININKYTKEECEQILLYADHWGWNEELLGKKPFLFDFWSNYKKPNNFKYRLRLLFIVIWPFTKADYIQPIRREIHRKYPDLCIKKHSELDKLREFFV